MHNAVIITLFTIMGISSALIESNIGAKRPEHVNLRLNQRSVRLDPCMTCLNAIEGSISTLLYFIHDTSMTGSCDTLCEAVADRTRSHTAGALCDLVCQATGIDKFVKTVEEADLDPIRYCQIATLCPGRIYV
jgi:hypothetical protein